MNEYELIEALRATGSLISQDFEFFITVTFALIFASYAVGDKMGKFPRVIIALLYLASITLFVVRYQTFVVQAQFLMSELKDINSVFPLINVVLASSLRKFIFAVGSLVAVYTLFWPVVAPNMRKADGKST